MKKGLKASDGIELNCVQSTILAVNNQPYKPVMETNYQVALEQKRICGKSHHCRTDRISFLLCLVLQIPQPVLKSTSPNDRTTERSPKAATQKWKEALKTQPEERFNRRVQASLD